MSAALSNAGCCSHRKTVKETRSEATEHLQTGGRTESRSESEHAATLTNRREREGQTETEIEIYDTSQPPDSTTGRPPVKARIRQRHGEKEQSRTEAATAGREAARAEAEDSTAYDGGTLDEVTVTPAPTQTPNLWERLKQGAAWATAIMILAAAGWIIYKLNKRRTT